MPARSERYRKTQSNRQRGELQHHAQRPVGSCQHSAGGLRFRQQGARLTSEQLAEQTRDGYEANKTRFDRELETLKMLVEGAAERR